MEDRFKFRVWDKENNKMFTPPRHFNYSNVNGTIVCIESFCQYDSFYQKRIIKEFNDATLMQCTGLKDKNGKVIYEGDIVKTSPSGFFDGNRDIFYVKFTDGYRLAYKDWQTLDTIGGFSNKLFEVIGNIYENADLLKEGKE